MPRTQDRVQEEIEQEAMEWQQLRQSQPIQLGQDKRGNHSVEYTKK